MIVSLPDNGVVAPGAAPVVRESVEGARQPVAKQGARELPARDQSGGALQTLFNVTLDCVRGRYDR